MKHPTPNIQQLETERKKLLVSKSNPKRLKEITDKLEYIYYGITNKC
jgi:hypothetical protein